MTIYFAQLLGRKAKVVELLGQQPKQRRAARAVSTLFQFMPVMGKILPCDKHFHGRYDSNSVPPSLLQPRMRAFSVRIQATVDDAFVTRKVAGLAGGTNKNPGRTVICS